MQIFFKKNVSSLWQQKLEEQYGYDDELLFKKLRKIGGDIGD
jgi:hypothetical protein